MFSAPIVAGDCESRESRDGAYFRSDKVSDYRESEEGRCITDEGERWVIWRKELVSGTPAPLQTFVSSRYIGYFFVYCLYNVGNISVAGSVHNELYSQ